MGSCRRPGARMRALDHRDVVRGAAGAAAEARDARAPSRRDGCLPRRRRGRRARDSMVAARRAGPDGSHGPRDAARGRSARIRRLAGRGARAGGGARPLAAALREEPGRRLRRRAPDGVVPGADRAGGGRQRLRPGPRRGDRLPRERRPPGGHRRRRPGERLRPHADPRRDGAELPRDGRRSRTQSRAHRADRQRRAPRAGGARAAAPGAAPGDRRPLRPASRRSQAPSATSRRPASGWARTSSRSSRTTWASGTSRT